MLIIELTTFFVIFYHAESERVDVIDIFKAILPRHEALDVDVELIPNVHDGMIILLIPKEHNNLSVTCKQNNYLIRTFFRPRLIYIPSIHFYSLIGEANAEWVWWGNEQTHRGN